MESQALQAETNCSMVKTAIVRFHGEELYIRRKQTTCTVHRTRLFMKPEYNHTQSGKTMSHLYLEDFCCTTAVHANFGTVLLSSQPLLSSQLGTVYDL